MPRVTLHPLQPDQIDTLRNLMQLYLYDFSIYFCDDPTDQISEQGLFPFPYSLDRYLEDSRFSAYLGRTSGKLAGFSLVSDRLHHRQGQGRLVEEFFVLGCYRRQGVGRSIAIQTFDTYRGYWEIVEVAPNKPAQSFWRNVVGDYTQGRYEERIGKRDEIWQLFDSSTW